MELCESLLKYYSSITPEKGGIDIILDGWAIELKTIDTNYKHNGVENKTRPITENVKGVVGDFEKLKSTSYGKKCILFVVFPVDESNRYWLDHLKKISNLLKKFESKEFKFKDGIPGIIYFGLI